MANDPLALAGITAGLPQQAEYDAVYAAVTATERGRWFLAEYASRNRQADTDLLVAAIARIEAVIRGDAVAQSTAVAGRDLTDIATAIDRIRTAIGTERTRLSDIGAAAERIADITFELRERAVKTALCDALDAEVSEICKAAANAEAPGENAHDPVKLLRELASRVDVLIRLSLAGQAASPISNHDADDSAAPAANNGAVAPGETPPAALVQPQDGTRGLDEGSSPGSGSFDMELQDNKKFAEAAAALAASLSSLTDESQVACEPQSQSFETVAALPNHAETSEPPAAAAADQRPRWYIEPPDFAIAPPGPKTNNGDADSPNQSGQAHPLLPGAQLLPDPGDDPADLFEPTPHSAGIAPDSAPKSPAATAAPVPSAPPAAAPAVEPQPPQLRIATASAIRQVPRPAQSNPLAALRALSEEELIALFG